MFTETDAGLMFTLLPAPAGRDLLAILDRVIRRVARRLAREQPDDAAADESPPELFAQIQAEAATTWRSPATADRVRGSDRLRAWCDGFPLHAGVVVPDDDRAGLELVEQAHPTAVEEHHIECRAALPEEHEQRAAPCTPPELLRDNPRQS